MSKSRVTFPAQVSACLNRATRGAVRTIRAERGRVSGRRALQRYGAGVIQREAAQTGGHHPVASHALVMLEEVLRDLMIEAAREGLV
ncbi:hypothetical protein AU374_05355 [Cupriavidus metallidurans]|jgi:hypothetical protein|nr:hypothetical protein AU374_05355 [Cupriavidus metallidurans]